MCDMRKESSTNACMCHMHKLVVNETLQIIFQLPSIMKVQFPYVLYAVVYFLNA